MGGIKVWVVKGYHTHMPSKGHVISSVLPDANPDRAIIAAEKMNDIYHGIFFERYQAERITIQPASPEFTNAHRFPTNAEIWDDAPAPNYKESSWSSPDLSMLWLIAECVFWLVVVIFGLRWLLGL